MILFHLLLMAAAPQAPAAALAAPPAESAPQVRTLATIELEGNPKLAAIELVQVGDERLFLRKTDRKGARAGGVELAELGTLLAVLADKRLAPFWPLILDRAGPDLARHRDRLLARTEAGTVSGVPQLSPEPGATGVAFVDAWALAALQRYSALVEAGRFEEGRQELTRAIARAAGMKSEQGVLNEFSLRAKLAASFLTGGDPERALAILEEGERNPNVGDTAVNYAINRAAILGRIGRYAEALALIDSAEATARKKKLYMLADAGLHFGWVRACALSGLGRAAEAQREYAPMRASGPHLANTRISALLCMKDEDGLASELVAQLNGSEIPVDAALGLQPAYAYWSFHKDGLAKAFARPEVRAAFDARARILPPELEPALRRWSGAVGD